MDEGRKRVLLIAASCSRPLLPELPTRMDDQGTRFMGIGIRPVYLDFD
jgi:hypothetical protein